MFFYIFFNNILYSIIMQYILVMSPNLYCISYTVYITTYFTNFWCILTFILYRQSVMKNSKLTQKIKSHAVLITKRTEQWYTKLHNFLKLEDNDGQMSSVIKRKKHQQHLNTIRKHDFIQQKYQKVNKSLRSHNLKKTDHLEYWSYVTKRENQRKSFCEIQKTFKQTMVMC